MSSKKDEYLSIPTLTGFLINRKGVVIRASDRSVVKQGFAADYLCINVDGVSHHIHRLMAITFLPKPDIPISELDVNHKDGNKLNNEISNLEWATRSENCLHAYKTGLRQDNVVVLVKDLRDGSVKEYYSLSECARCFDANPALIHQYLADISKIRKHFYVFIRKGQQWPNLSSADVTKRKAGVPIVLLGLHLESNVLCIFGSIGKAADELGIKAGSLYMHVKRYGEKPYHGYSFRFSDDAEQISKYSEQNSKRGISKKIRIRPPKPILVTDTETGISKRWESTEEFAKHVGAKKGTIQARIHRTGGYWNKYEIKYLIS